MTRLLLCLVFFAACADRDRDVKSATLGDLEYAVPEGWTMRDASEPGSTILIWTPTHNARKQSVTIVRTRSLPDMARADHKRLAATLGQTLQQPARPIRTKQLCCAPSKCPFVS